MRLKLTFQSQFLESPFVYTWNGGNVTGDGLTEGDTGLWMVKAIEI